MRTENIWLTRLLLLTLVSQILLATWALVNVGSTGPTRYDDWGAELLCALAGATAGCTWLAYQWKRIGAYGMFLGLGLVALFLLTNKPKEPAALPGGESTLTAAIVLIVALGTSLYLTIRPVWRNFEIS